MAASIAVTSPIRSQTRTRIALITSADSNFRQRLRTILTGLRWQVREARAAAEAWDEACKMLPQVMIVDCWLPDLERDEFLREFHISFPEVNLVSAGDGTRQEGAPGPHHHEILYALRQCQDSDTAAWNVAPILEESLVPPALYPLSAKNSSSYRDGRGACTSDNKEAVTSHDSSPPIERIPELIGNSASMLEVSRRIRKVAPRDTPVLIEGPTGSGKELVAAALHRLSSRNRRAFVAINCAAIPEALLEAELFGHTRGAFTGAVQGRIGRIEAADGGTLFLDEIGEMPLALQSKLLRFVESGELQRVGDNEPVKVDVRIIAATHQPLGQHAQEGLFRADLYYRLAVFLIRTPAMTEHIEDLPLLVEYFLERLGRAMPVKHVSEGAMAKLKTHGWPGNVRELEHVLERAVILADDGPLVSPNDIEFGDVVH
jgi:DNA-binding NtrC family response regulator